MNKGIKVEKLLAEVSMPWEGKSFILTCGLKDAKDFLERHGGYETGTIRDFLYYILENYEGAELRDLRTRGKKVIALLAFSDEEQFADFCKNNS